MRHQTIARAAAAVIATGFITAALPAGTAAAATAEVPLPLSHFSNILSDAGHEHLFITGGAGEDTVLVTDFDGRTVATIRNEPGASGLALSDDGQTVYTTLAKGDAVSAISTDSLTETARYATGSGTAPTSIAFTGGKVWFGYGTGWDGSIGSIDPEPGTVTLKAAPGSFYYAPRLAGSVDDHLVAATAATSPAELTAYDVSDGTAVVTAHKRIEEASSAGDLKFTPDGTEVVLASGAPYKHQVFKTADLSPALQYNSTAYPNSVAITDDGTVIGGAYNPYGDTVYVFAPGQADPINKFKVPGLLGGGLAVTPDGDKIFAVSNGSNGTNGKPVLNVIPLTN